MESIDLDLDDIMEPAGDLDDLDDIPRVTALPAFDDGDNLLDTSVQNDGLLDTLLDPGGEQEGEAPAKRVVNRKPIPKLDPVRLTGERGLPALMKHFEKVKFKGKGHEVSDLDKLMRTLEHWAHRMFPKMPFDDVIERIEKLGSKKPVQTCLKKIRMDMPLLDDDFVVRGEDEVIVMDGAHEEEVDEMDDIFPAPSMDTTHQPPIINANTPKITMTEEQKEKIERNKRLAMERRLAKQQKDSDSSQQQPDSQNTGLKASELDDFFAMETGQKSTASAKKDIDSDEEEAERMMWDQLMGGTGKKDGKKEQEPGQKRKAAKGAKQSEVIEIDSDDDEMENEIWNQMTEPVPSQSQKASKEAEEPVITKKKKRRVILDDDEDDDAVIAVEKDVCNEMTELIPSQSFTDLKPKERNSEMSAKRKGRVVSDDIDSDEAEMENEIWNQMTEPIPTQKVDKESCIETQTPAEDNTKNPEDVNVEADICHQMTEPVDSLADNASQTTRPSQENLERSQIIELPDDDLDDSTMWTQITSTNPGDELPSSHEQEEDDEEGLPSSLSKEEEDVPGGSGAKDSDSEQEDEINAPAKSKKRSVIIDDDEDEDE